MEGTPNCQVLPQQARVPLAGVAAAEGTGHKQLEPWSAIGQLAQG